jgi:hypothetical protein
MFTQLSIPTLRRSRDTRDSTWISNWREGPTTLIEVRGNPLLCIIRKKFGKYIYICM